MKELSHILMILKVCQCIILSILILISRGSSNQRGGGDKIKNVHFVLLVNKITLKYMIESKTS